MNYVKLTEEQFSKAWTLTQNHLCSDAPFSGCMYETYGREMDYIRGLMSSKDRRQRVWTVIEGDNGDVLFVSGFHMVNRLGHLVSEEDVPDNTEYEVAFKLHTRRNTPVYFLFGEEIVSVLLSSQNGDFNPVIDAINCGMSYDIYKFTKNTNPIEFLEAYKGWGDYAVIEESEYKQIRDLSQ